MKWFKIRGGGGGCQNDWYTVYVRTIYTDCGNIIATGQSYNSNRTFFFSLWHFAAHSSSSAAGRRKKRFGSASDSVVLVQ